MKCHVLLFALVGGRISGKVVRSMPCACRSLRSAALLVSGLLSAALVVACSAGGGHAAKSTTPPASPSTSPTLSPGDQALAAYTGMWQAAAKASLTSDPDAPDLRRYAQDDALKLLVSALAADRKSGRVAKGRPTLAPRVTSVKPVDAPTTVAIRDCLDDSNWLEVRKSDGKPVDKVPGGHHDVTAKVVTTTAGWKVSSFTLKAAGTC
jgi:hypothetical protein